MRYRLIDMDSENKSRGSLAHFFPEARKTNIQRERGMDGLMFALEEGTPIVVADMGAGAGDVAHEWFDSMYADALTYGSAFTAIGLVTPIRPVFRVFWRGGTFYRIGLTISSLKTPLSTRQTLVLGERPAGGRVPAPGSARTISMQYRVQDIEQVAREHGVTMEAVADGEVDVTGLKEMPNVMRANGYRRNLFAELEA